MNVRNWISNTARKYGLPVWIQQGSWKKENLLFLQYVPQQYRDLAHARDTETTDQVTSELLKIEQPRSPNQYADWFCNILQAVHPRGQPALDAQTIKECTKEVFSIFLPAANNMASKMRILKKETLERLSTPAYRDAEQCPSSRTPEYILMKMPELEDARVEDPSVLHLRRYKSGLGIVPVIIHPDWITQFDRVSRWNSIEQTTAWYTNLFDQASETGNFI